MTTLVTTRSVPTDGTTLHVLDIGPAGGVCGAAPLVFSHGAGGCHLNWYQQVSEFSRDHRVIVWDQRGFGRSTDPTGLASPEQAADDLLAVLDACEVDGAWLVAQSMAGWSGSLCIEKHPERFRGVVLCDSSAGVVTPRTAQRLEQFVADSRARAQSGTLFSSLAVDDSWITRERDRATVLQLWSRALPSTYASAVHDLATTHVGVDHLRDLPVGVIVGEKDRIFPPDTLREAFGEVADLGVHEIAGAGHSPYLEEPEQFNAIVRAMLTGPVAG